jgi:hypothetical protein
MATVNLGSIKFKWKGTYAGGTAYTIDDVVSYNGSSYICIQASTGNLPTDTSYFEQMSQKGSDGTNGTDGTDLTTTLTTQGDTVVRGASGLERLAIGTAGQALKVNSSANGLEYGSAGKNMVLKAMTTQSALTSSTDLINANIVTTKANPTIQVSSLISLNTRVSSDLDDENIKFDIRYSTDGGSTYATLADDIYKTDVFSPGYSQTHSNNYDINVRPASASIALSGVSAGTTVNIVIRLDYSAVNNGQTIYINRAVSTSGRGSSHLLIYEE